MDRSLWCPSRPGRWGGRRRLRLRCGLRGFRLPHRFFVFPVSLAAQSEQVVFLRESADLGAGIDHTLRIIRRGGNQQDRVFCDCTLQALALCVLMLISMFLIFANFLYQK